MKTTSQSDRSASGVSLGNKKTLTLWAAKGIAEASQQAATAYGWNMVIAIVDDGGNLLYLARMDEGPAGSVEVAQQKARSAVMFKAPTKAFEDGVNAGVTSLLKLEILPFEGGIPITVDGKIIGAVGVSGGSASSQDGRVAQAGIEWLTNQLK